MSYKSNVRALLFNTDGKMLLVQHRPESVWVLPGGHLEQGETFHQALVRELKEELSLDATVVGLLSGVQCPSITELPLPVCVFNLLYTHAEFGEVYKYEQWYVAMTQDTHIDKQTQEIYDYRWLSIDEVIAMSTDVSVESRKSPGGATVPAVPQVVANNRDILEQVVDSQ